MHSLYVISNLLSAVILALAFNYRRALAFPKWLYAAEELETPDYKEIARAVGVGLLATAIISLTVITASQLHREASDPANLLYFLPLLASGWIAGRFGGKYGLACAVNLALILLLFIPGCTVVGVLLRMGSPQQAQAFAGLLLSEWWNEMLPYAPVVLLFTLSTAILGAWVAKQSQAKKKAETEGRGSSR